MSINKRVYDAKKSANHAVNYLSNSHHLAFSTDATTGTLAIAARAPGAAVFEPIPDAGALDLSVPISIQVIGVIAEMNFELAGDDATEVLVTHSYEV